MPGGAKHQKAAVVRQGSLRKWLGRDATTGISIIGFVNSKPNASVTGPVTY